MIIIKDVSMKYPVRKRYVEYIRKPFQHDEYVALNNISMTIEKGDRIAFMGANGAGKTTLLKLIGGLLYPTEGAIEVDGYDTVKKNKKARNSVGFVLNEERSFYWRLSGVQNMEFFGTLDNLKGKVLSDKVRSLMTLVGLDGTGEKLFANYSSGMKQRLAIARGLIADPSILILDEPTRTLDPVATRDVKDILLQRVHANRQRTLLIATHSLPEAQALCNRICFMKKGKVVLFSPLREILSQYGSLDTCYNSVFKSHLGPDSEKEFNSHYNTVVNESL